MVQGDRGGWSNRAREVQGDEVGEGTGASPPLSTGAWSLFLLLLGDLREAGLGSMCVSVWPGATVFQTQGPTISSPAFCTGP